MPRAPAARARSAVGGHDHDRRVEGALHPGLEQQRHLHDGNAALPASPPPGDDPLADEGVQGASSQVSSSGRPKTIAPTAAAVDAAAGATSGPQRSTSESRTRVGTEQLVHDGVGGQRRGASRSSAASASDLPAAIAPVRPTNGVGARRSPRGCQPAWLGSSGPASLGRSSRRRVPAPPRGRLGRSLGGLGSPRRLLGAAGSSTTCSVGGCGSAASASAGGPRPGRLGGGLGRRRLGRRARRRPPRRGRGPAPPLSRLRRAARCRAAARAGSGRGAAGCRCAARA